MQTWIWEISCLVVVTMTIQFVSCLESRQADFVTNHDLKSNRFPLGSQKQKRQLDGIHHKIHLTTAIPTGLLGVNDVDALFLHENDIFSNYSKRAMPKMMLRVYREGDGFLSCRKCGSYSIGPRGQCCQGCTMLGYNGCWCRMCDCLCYHY